jgi:hypothetical protein
MGTASIHEGVRQTRFERARGAAGPRTRDVASSSAKMEHRHEDDARNPMIDRQNIAFFFEPSNQNDEKSLAGAHQIEFKADFLEELERLEIWAGEQRLNPLPVPELHVTVSQRFRISRALNPAWSGLHGHMEFPVSRVAARKAAIAHELTHVFFPNANRFLAEGLAVYVQAEIGGNPAFPNFGQPLHDTARQRVRVMVSLFAGDALDCVGELRLAALDEIATPNPLVLQVGTTFHGENAPGQANIYAITGSFTQFLVETFGLDKFKSIYGRTPLVPLAQNAGLPDRWNETYGFPLADLEEDWKRSVIAGSPVRDGQDVVGET